MGVGIVGSERRRWSERLDIAFKDSGRGGVAERRSAGEKNAKKETETNTEVGDEGIELGEREPTRCVRRCCEVRWDNRCSLAAGLARCVLEVTCRKCNSLVGLAIEGDRATRRTVSKDRATLREERRTSLLLCSDGGGHGARLEDGERDLEMEALSATSSLYLQPARDADAQGAFLMRNCRGRHASGRAHWPPAAVHTAHRRRRAPCPAQKTVHCCG